MKLYSFTCLLPEELQMKYYESIIRDGFISDDLWDNINDYIKSTFKEVDNLEDEIKDVLKNLNTDNRKVLYEIISVITASHCPKIDGHFCPTTTGITAD
jgi:hypothetical protein